MNAPKPKSPVPFRHHGLMSLWDMLEINAEPFYKAINALRELEFLIEAKAKDKQLIPHLKETSAHLSALEEACKALGADAARSAIMRLNDHLKSGTAEVIYVRYALKDIRQRFQDQIMYCQMFGITKAEVRRYIYFRGYSC